MATRNVTSGKDHHHQDRSDGDRRKRSRSRLDHCVTNCEDEKKSSDKSNQIFPHNRGVIRTSRLLYEEAQPAGGPSAVLPQHHRQSEMCFHIRTQSLTKIALEAHALDNPEARDEAPLDFLAGFPPVLCE